MKRIVLFSLFLLYGMNISSVAADKSLYQSYFWLKESCLFYILGEFFWDLQKIEQAQLICRHCKYQVDAFDLYGYAVARVDTILLSNLQFQMRYGTVQQLLLFLENAYQEHHIECCMCDWQYHGWDSAERNNKY